MDESFTRQKLLRKIRKGSFGHRNRKNNNLLKRPSINSKHIAGLHCHAIKNKHRNHSINLGSDSWLTYKQPGARFSKAPETFRAHKTIFSSSVSENVSSVYGWSFLHEENLCLY